MTQDEASRQYYYQEIARRFLRHQTSMFFLPPPDLALISDWKSWAYHWSQFWRALTGLLPDSSKEKKGEISIHSANVKERS